MVRRAADGRKAGGMSDHANLPSPAQLRSGSSTDVAIICVTHNSQDVIEDFANSIPPAAANRIYRVCIVDSGSSDGTPESCTRLLPRANLWELDGNRGFAAGINLALRRLGGSGDPPRAVVVANPDVRFRAGSIAALLERLDANEQVGVAVPRLVDEHGLIQLSLRNRPSVAAAWSEAIVGGPLAHRLGLPTEVIRESAMYENEVDVGWALGGLMAISWTCITEVGYWDESYFLYEEEVDFCERVHNCEFKVRYCPQATATRVVGDGGTAPWIQALMRVNRLSHMRRRRAVRAALAMGAALLVGDLLRSLLGRTESRAGAWALLSGAGVRDVLRRYRPTAEVILSDQRG